MKRIILGLFYFLMLQNAYADEISDILWDKLSHIRAMKASFSQQIYAKQRVLTQSSGKMAFVRPRQFRWETTQPMEQLLIADGKKIWMYDVDLEQVTVKPQTESMGAAAGLFLSENKVNLTSDFSVKSEREGKQEVFTLKARGKQANIQRMILRFAGDALESMELYDQLGQRTAVRFNQAKINVILPEHLFQFTPPEGVDVVQQ
ncbi:MAG: outer membrane lipoprotein chaperone LolA [Legionella sp.]|jgi:outer membrane lipoprotein carrier protein|nr:outer membrane lipoprotein chaperone LolA [Legionella sp.]